MKLSFNSSGIVGDLTKRLARRIQTLLSSMGIGVTSAKILADLRRSHESWQKIAVVANAQQDIAPKLLQLLDRSSSQLRQDLFVLSHHRLKRDGYFVEFGATDGKGLSNTYLLEKEFGWNGILVEPARSFHDSLRRNRKSEIDTRAVWSETGLTVLFAENPQPYLSAIEEPTKRASRSRHPYEVETVSLPDLLKHYRAPTHIDYLSIDVEGSELNILKSCDFQKYRFGVITVEHSYRKDRSEIFKLLTSNGYRRVLEHISWWDDWYIGPA
jgi:FkbM family methyltransferase